MVSSQECKDFLIFSNNQKDIQQENILINMIQIKQLQWIGSSKNCKKIGKWIATMNGQVLGRVGGYYSENGKKQGLWQNIIENYEEISNNVLEFGKYYEDKKQGIWKYKYLNELIDGGIYDEYGLKQGRWIDLNQKFWDFSQVIQEGQYRNNIKFGRWNINYREYGMKNFEIVGWGQFENDGLKNGKWIELSENFWDLCQIIYIGEYQNDIKIGLWDINVRRSFSEQFKKIGQGLFDEQGLKNGYWTEINHNFNRFSQITQNGEYQHGNRIGRWRIYYRRDYNESLEIMQKLGKNNFQRRWIIQQLRFKDWLLDRTGQSILHNGLKYGIWEIKHRREQQNFEKIGGGLYDEKGRKNGEWIDLIDDFYSNISYSGIYQNGYKIGRWNIYCRNMVEDIIMNKDQKIINGQITLNGEYQEGKKIGIWNINYKKSKEKPYEIIGGGSYNIQMQKNGKWIELSNNFWDYCQITYDGIYENGLKLGRWNINYRNNGQSQFYAFGGGIYKKYGFKQGQWIEISDNFQEDQQVAYQGQYNSGLKVNRWNILYRDYYDSQFNIIGSGAYDDFAQKTGKWIELSENYSDNFKIIYHGEYVKGLKFGLWDIIQYRKDNYHNELIGYGLYNSQGYKNGKWIELKNEYNETYQNIFIGVYYNSKKYGKWDIMERNINNINQEFEKIGEQYFN
ncbi:unnamed protein product [Paramecium sonneborni]|uniref:Uncharacterized protein n=1 Tax=Paramecium sonneborni TaxID=65129 RepID=A0A8S1RVW0_9CILI|nr:unnamed protein product [Paramecium sonneborni]